MSTSPRYGNSLEAASAQAQAGSVPGSDESSGPPPNPRENGDNGPSPPKQSVALQQWLAESQKDGPFNILALARTGASGQAESATPPFGGSQDGPSSHATGPLNADKPPSG